MRNTTSSVPANARFQARNLAPSILSPMNGVLFTNERAICEPNPAAKRRP